MFLYAYHNNNAEWVPLKLSADTPHCCCRVGRITGASSLLIDLQAPERQYRFEIPVWDNHPVTLHLKWTQAGVEAFVEHRTVFLLPIDAVYGPDTTNWQGGPVHAFAPNTTASSLDIALVVDGTMQIWDPPRRSNNLLLDDKQRWKEMVDSVLLLVQELAAPFSRTRVATLAFGDHIPHAAAAPDLKPKYLLYPKESRSRRLEPYQKAELKDSLSRLSATSGGDFVDALAEGLKAARELDWKADARKLVIVVGDSPGASVMDPAPWGADLHVRSLDVDHELLQLHRSKIEIASIYSTIPDTILEISDIQKQLWFHARTQYQRIATSPNHFTQFPIPESFGEGLKNWKGLLARGACAPVLDLVGL